MCFLLSGHRAQGSDFVTARVWADPGYAAQKAARSGLQNETYVVAEGEYFDGTYWDPSISKASLEVILHFLAPTLTKQHYFPAKDLKAADQLLVVHWGTTMGYQNEYMQTENSLPTPPAFHGHGPMQQSSADDLFQASRAANVANQAAHAMTTSTAEGLLGYTMQLIHERQKMMTSEVERTLEANLHEDRYFVILQAYDFQKLLKGEGRKLLWSVHMSMRSPGLSFTLALPRMGQVASDLYGQNSDDLVTGKFLAGKNSSVEIGPITILAQATQAEAKK